MKRWKFLIFRSDHKYAETLGAPLLLGREIGLQDTPASTKVAVVNKAFADYYFAGQNPIGRRITFDQESDKDDLEIVGVIGDVKNDSAREKAERTVYQPIFPNSGPANVQQHFGVAYGRRSAGPGRLRYVPRSPRSMTNCRSST